MISGRAFYFSGPLKQARAPHAYACYWVVKP